MHIKKAVLVVGAVTSVGLAGLASVNSVSAATDTSGNSLVSKIAQKVNLSEDDIQAVFDQDKTEREATREQHLSDRLQSAVDDGELTAAQKSTIEAKLKALQAARQTEREALEAWAEANDIDQKYLMMGGRHGMDIPVRDL